MAELAFDNDPRWYRLLNTGYKCSSCDEIHVGIFDLGWDAPAYWSGAMTIEPNSRVRGAKHILTEDFCILDDEYFFARCILPIPIKGSDEHVFGLGVWSSLSRKSFDEYLSEFDSDHQSHLEGWFGWLSNSIPGLPETLSLPCVVYPQDGRNRPEIALQDAQHPLVEYQREGIDLDTLLALYAASGHGLMKSLGD